MELPRSPSAKFILRGQAIGFSFLMVFIWAAEFLHVPYYFFGDLKEVVWTRILFRTAILAFIWLIVHLTTSRLLKRLHELERFLRICSWCRKVGDRGEWLTLEEYFDTRFHTDTSHSICPGCAKRQLDQVRTAVRVKPGTSDKPASTRPE